MQALTGTGICHLTPVHLTAILIAVPTIIDARTAFVIIIPAKAKNVHDHAGIVFAFSCDPRSRLV